MRDILRVYICDYLFKALTSRTPCTSQILAWYECNTSYVTSRGVQNSMKMSDISFLKTKPISKFKN